MAETKPIQIFLCHASEDKAAVLDIYNRLKALGYKPWLDKKDLLPGPLWEEEIPKAIRASDFILIFLSKTSVAKRGYVQNEFKLALEVFDEMPEGTIYAIPVRLDDCTVPNQFRKFHWCNLFEVDGFENLLRALQAGRLSLQQAAAPHQPTPLVPATPAPLKDDPALTRQPFETDSREESGRIVPKDIFFRIEPDTSLELVREILSSPHKIYKSMTPAFSTAEIRTTVWHYSFPNADIEIESDDGEVVKVMTLQSHDAKPYHIFEIPFSEPIGVLTIQDVLQECGAEKVEYFTSMRDAYLAIECYKGRLGGYLIYTLGCYGHPDLTASRFVDGKLHNTQDEEVDLSQILVNFVSITHEENRGHPIPQGI